MTNYKYSNNNRATNGNFHWIYILKGSCGQKYYVGETTRLYRRFWEHDKGDCSNTCGKGFRVVAIYKKDNMGTFFDYNEKIINNKNLQSTFILGVNNPKYLLNNWNKIGGFNHREIKNNIVECMMLGDYHHWKDIRGGKYTKFNCNYKFPENEYVKELPLCHCGLPCDVRKKEENDYIFFRCSKKNFWPGIREKFEIDDEPCKFFKKYTKDETYKSNISIDESWLENVPSHKVLSGGDNKRFSAYCIAYDAMNEKKYREEYGEDYEDWRKHGGRYGGTCRYYKDRDMKNYKGVRRCLCDECFKKHKLELSKIFTKTS